MAITALKRYMFENDISLKELQIGTKISMNNLSRIVNGYQRPRADTAYKIADYLDIHVNKLFPNYYTYEELHRKRTQRQGFLNRLLKLS